MNYIRKFIATTLGAVLIFSQVAFAQDSPAVILQDAIRNSMDVTSSVTTGDLNGIVIVDGEEVGSFEASIYIATELNIEESLIKLYVRVPFFILALDPITGEEYYEAIEVVFFMDGNTINIYLTDEGWFTEELPYQEMELTPEFIQWSIETAQFLYDKFPSVFSDYQVDGYYVIDILINNEGILNFLGSIFDYNFILNALTFVGTEYDLYDFQQMGEEEFQELTQLFLEELTYLLEMFEIEAIYRNFIDVATRNFQAFDVYLIASVLMDMGFLGTLDLEIELSGSFEVLYDVQIEWPTIN